MHLNHPETILLPPATPSLSVEKLSSTKPVPGANELGAAGLSALGVYPQEKERNGLGFVFFVGIDT